MANNFVNYSIPLLRFVLIASPAFYKATRGVLGNWVSNVDGRASFLGLMLHAIIFVAVVGYIMRSTQTVDNFTTRKDQQEEEYVHWMQLNNFVDKY